MPASPLDLLIGSAASPCNAVAQRLAVMGSNASRMRYHIFLRVHPYALTHRGQQIRGAWDPTTRSIDLWLGEWAKDDAALIEALAHELAHALFRTSKECVARCWATELVAAMDKDHIIGVAQGVRKLAPQYAEFPKLDIGEKAWMDCRWI